MLTDEMCVEIAKTAVPKVLDRYGFKDDPIVKVMTTIAVDATLTVLKEYERLNGNQ